MKFDLGSEITTEAAASLNSGLYYLSLKLGNFSLFSIRTEHCSLER